MTMMMMMMMVHFLDYFDLFVENWFSFLL